MIDVFYNTCNSAVKLRVVILINDLFYKINHANTYIFRVAERQLEMSAAKCFVHYFFTYLVLTIVHLLLSRAEILPTDWNLTDGFTTPLMEKKST